MLRPLTALVVPAFILSVSGTVSAAVLNVKFTSQALGLGSSEINEGTTVESNIAGKLITSSVTGFGSTLFVQRSGLAGSGTISDPLLLKVTCRTRLDTVTGLPGSGGSEGNNNGNNNGNKNGPKNGNKNANKNGNNNNAKPAEGGRRRKTRKNRK